MTGGVMVATGSTVQLVVQQVLFGASLADASALVPLHMAFALFLATVFLAGAHTIRLIGVGQFLSVLAGRYRRPVEEKRVLLFVDLKGSTRLAEHLGPVQVATLIARFFFDMDEIVAEHGGEVHAYIGDELIVTWPTAEAVREAACLRCVFAMRGRVRELARSYEAEFGVVPHFRAVLHSGPVVMSEVGRARQQIGYFGDTMNVTARLEEHAKLVDRDLLISRLLAEQLALPELFAVEDLGQVELRGRIAPVSVLALRRAC